MLALFLGFAALCSAAVGYGFYRTSLDSFQAQKYQEKITALRLVDAFVTSYTKVRQDMASNAPVPATFRAHTLEAFNKQAGGNADFLLRWVGREGRQIATPPTDTAMARIIESFVGMTDPKPVSTVEGRSVFRTVYPSLAREEGCVSCHNALQPGNAWKLNDVMGAFAIDVPLARFLAEIEAKSILFGMALFLALAAAGSGIALLNRRHLAVHERQALAMTRTEQELRATNEQLVAATHAKSQFLANMSHEIRTPMNGVFGMTELLMRTRLSDHQHRLVSTIGQSAKTLLTIINDILDISRIEAGRMTMERKAFDIRACAEGAVDLFIEEATRKGLSLALYVAPEVPPLVLGDAGRMRQVCINLIGNAVKFTHVGEVALRITADPDPNGMPALQLEIADTGIGIASDALETLCKPFAQADSSITRRFGGTGLGLSISRHLVELMGGRLDIRSALGKGTCIFIDMPLQTAGVDDAASAADLLSGKRVLVIDDRETNRAVMAEYLAAAGAEPVLATSVPEGMCLLNEAVRNGEPFAAAIVEVMMPDTTGLDFLRVVSTMPEHQDLKAIMLTAMNWPGDSNEIRRLGAVALLNKPVHQRVLVATVAAALGIGQQDHAVSGRSAISPREKIDARVLVAEDNPVNVEVASAFLEMHGCHVIRAADGREAVDAFARSAFDLILMDCQMPELDGLAATRLIRAREDREGLQRTPVIAVTASAFEEDRQACLAAGMDDFLSKPFTNAELTAMLVRWAGASRQTDASAPAVPESPETPSREQSTVVALARPAHDDLLARQLRSFLTHAPNAIESLRQALDRCDCVALKLAAHSLKSSCAGIGADDVAQILLAIEKSALVSDLHAATNHMQRLGPDIGRLLERLETEVEQPRIERTG